MRITMGLGLFALVWLVGCSPGGRNTADPAHGQAVSTPSAKTDAAPGKAPGLRVIDVRTDEEWAEDHVAGAMHLPLDQVREKISTVVPDRQTAIGVYCASGMRSARAAQILQELGYTHVENLGGLEEAKQKVNQARGIP